MFVSRNILQEIVIMSEKIATKIAIISIVVFTIIQNTTEYNNYKSDRRPKIMGDTIPFRGLSPYRRKVQKKIVAYHNFFRTRVDPPAANMLRMKWHKGAAKAAQRWADECLLLIHDNETGRYIHNYGACGQNIFIASHKVPWLFAIKTWYNEKEYFTFGKKNNLTLVGHYTQMIWGTTHEVGCGISKCYHNGNDIRGKLFYNYVCNYCPIGNRPGRIGRPYRKGKFCGMCKKHCHANKLCLNSCPVANNWANCRELYKVWPNWLCHTNSTKGRERFGNCKATCGCRNKLHD